MRLALVLLLLAGRAHAEAPRPPAHYAKLFQQGATWTYDVAVTTWDHEKLQAMEAKGIKIPSPRWPRRTDREPLKCKVDRVATYVKAIVSEVSCDKELWPMINIAGVFLATGKGLYRLGEFPTKEAELPSPLDDGDVVIAAAPKVFRTETKIEKEQGGGKAVRGIRIEGGAWCVYDELIANYAGHNGKGSTCYGRGILVRVAHDFGPELRDIKIRAR